LLHCASSGKALSDWTRCCTGRSTRRIRFFSAGYRLSDSLRRGRIRGANLVIFLALHAHADEAFAWSVDRLGVGEGDGFGFAVSVVGGFFNSIKKEPVRKIVGGLDD